MLDQVRNALIRHSMVTPGDRVVVAVSGGPDSVALLHALYSLSGEFGITLHVFHMDHGLRGAASAEDADFVADVARSLGLPCTVATLPAGQLKELSGSLQANARQARYDRMAEVAAQVGARRLALGHNRDDQAETVLMRFLRGSGTRGLAGIAPIREEVGLTYIRPLLEIPRHDIEEYCRQNELTVRFDQSNEKPVYFRNRIRLELLPELARTYNPAIGPNLAQLAEVMRAEDQFLDTLALQAYERCKAPGEGVTLDGTVLLNEPLALARRVVRLAGRLAAGPGLDLGLSPVTQVLEAAARSEGSARVSLPGGLQVVVEYGICRFLPTEEPAARENEWPVAAAGVTLVPELGLELEAVATGKPVGLLEAAFDAARLPGPLLVRRRRPGDRLWPTGMEGSKKVQDVLVDAKVPRRLRDQVPLLTAGDDVLWVIGHRLDRRYLASAGSDRVILIRAKPVQPEA